MNFHVLVALSMLTCPSCLTTTQMRPSPPLPKRFPPSKLPASKTNMLYPIQRYLWPAEFARVAKLKEPLDMHVRHIRQAYLQRASSKNEKIDTNTTKYDEH